MTWYCHVNDFAKGWYGMILGRDLLTALGLNLKLSEHVTKSDYGPFKGSSAPMLDLVTYEFKYLNTGKLHPNNCL